MANKESYLFYSDYNCPFCHALNERIRTLGQSHQIEWRGIQHLPAASSHHVSLDDKTQISNEVSVIRQRASEVKLIAPDFRPNTLLANRLTQLLINLNAPRLDELRTQIYRAYWQLGLDISSKTVLREICGQVDLEFPKELESDRIQVASVDQLLDEWQVDWEGERFQTRLPIMVAKQADKPMMGFPTLNLLNLFLSGNELPTMPASMASCELRNKQTILLIGTEVEEHCKVIELKAAYKIHHTDTIEQANELFKKLECLPDLILLDYSSLAEKTFDYCVFLRQDPMHRTTSIIVLLAELNAKLELQAFDAGASDVLFDLSNPKICQARLETLLRAKQSRSLLSNLARVDYLTQLPNRLEYNLRLEDIWLHSRRLKATISLIFIDIDHFKNYNDTYGHSTGDDCLRQVAATMKGCLKRPSDILARYGGEEFVAILRDTTMEGAKKLAERMAKAVEALELPHSDSSAAEVVTISLGVSSMVPSMNTGPDVLEVQADGALYRAKENGRNQVMTYR